MFSSHLVFSSSSHIKIKKNPCLQEYFMKCDIELAISVPKDFYKCSKDINYVCARKDTYLSECFCCLQAKWIGEISVHTVQSSLSSRASCFHSTLYRTCPKCVTMMPHYRTDHVSCPHSSLTLLWHLTICTLLRQYSGHVKLEHLL